jgi:hypothetical protein
LSFVAGTRPNPVAGRVLTAFAAAIVFGALLLPNDIRLITPGAFLGIPAEALLAATLVLAVPGRIRAAVTGLIGAGLGAVTILKVLDMGFFATLNRSFDLLSDWRNLENAAIFVQQAAGEGGAIAAGVAAALLAVAVVALTTWAVGRLVQRVVVPHRRAAIGTIAVGTAVWTACLTTGTQLVPDFQLASDSTAKLALYRALDTRRDVLDLQQFKSEVPDDPFGTTPDDQLLAALRGKDVVIPVIESYGRVALEDPQLGPPIRALLDDGTKRLEDAGFAARSAYLTSPTTGAGSWLAHATFLSGLWVDSQHRHDALEASGRTTLVRDFDRAGWRTVGVMPGVFLDWPEAPFYGYDQIYDFQHLGYRGPRMSFATMPDQFTLKAFEQLEHSKPDRAPLMVEMPLVTSHAPWTPLPPFLDWNQLGDGSVYNSLAGQSQQPEAILSRDPAQVRDDYGKAIQYTLTSLISYIQNYGDDNTVVVMFGDHQPSPIVTGPTENRDIPITVIAKDPKVFDRIAGWHWQDGLRPGPNAPVWRMDAFRTEFLTAFNDDGSHRG